MRGETRIRCRNGVDHPRLRHALLACACAIALVCVTAGCEPPQPETKGKTESAEGTSEGEEATTEKGSEAEGEEGGESAEADEASADEADEEGVASAEGATANAEDAAKEGENDPDRLAPGETRHFGGEFTLDDEPIALTEAMKDLAELEGKPIKIEARVVTACRKKGCWMTIEPVETSDDDAAKADDDEGSIRVTFKDYGFFVPRHADGSTAVMEGQFEREVVTEAHRKHLARDAKKPEEEIAAIEGDLEVVQFVATAVDLTGAPAAEN